MRAKYHRWDDTSLAMLRSYREQNLSWEIIAGKISAIYDTLITAEGCRAAYNRHGPTNKTTHDPKTQTPGSQLPLAFTDPPAQVLEEIQSEKERLGFSRLYYIPYNATPQEIDKAITEHWNYYVNFVAESSDLNEDNIKAAHDHGPTKWFNRWIIGLSMWHPFHK